MIQMADFFKAVQSKLIPQTCFNILSRTKFKRPNKFTFRQLKCNHIWYMFAVIKEIETYLIYPVVKFCVSE